MGSGEESNTPTKPAKTAVFTQELPSTPYPDWASVQAYYGAGVSTPPFFPSSVPSSPPPYLWSGQPIMSPYGTPLPYPAMFHHGAIYGHPPMAAAQGTIISMETEIKSPDAKDNATTKPKGSSGNAVLSGGKSDDGGKAITGSANGGASHSGESGNEASTEASDEDSRREYSAARKKSFDQMIAEGANAQQNNTAHHSSSALETSLAARGPLAKLPITVPGKAVVTVPTTNLNIGMDIWNKAASAGSVPTKARPNAAAATSTFVPGAAVVCEGVMPDQQWMQDERELKRQKRKQSNRESARRSRLRKQAECEELAVKVESLRNENQSLRNELQRLVQACEKLRSENESLEENLTHNNGPGVSSVEVSNASASGFQSTNEGVPNLHDS